MEQPLPGEIGTLVSIWLLGAVDGPWCKNMLWMPGCLVCHIHVSTTYTPPTSLTYSLVLNKNKESFKFDKALNTNPEALHWHLEDMASEFTETILK